MKRALLTIFIFTLLFIAVSLIRHIHYFSQGNDLGIFDQSAWLYSRSLTPYNTITDQLDYQDRYKPIMFLMGIVYRFVPGPETLLILQALALTLSGFLIYLISRQKKLSFNLSLILTTNYLLFPGITSFLIDDFHEVSFFPLFFLATIYFYLVKRNKPLYLFLILSLLVRDYLVVFSLLFWFCFYLSKRKDKTLRNILLINVCMFLLMVLTIKVVGGVNYRSFVNEGDSLSGAIFYFIKNPAFAISSLFTPVVKIKTIIITLGYFLFLPLLNPFLIPVVIFQFVGRFLDFQHSYRWTILFHYSGELVALLSFGTILSFQKIKQKKKKNLLAFLLILTTLSSLFYFHSPLLLLRKKSFWQKEEWMKNIDLVIKEVPTKASIATQNNLVPHLSNREKVYVLPKVGDAEFILIDLREGQDQFNFYTLTYQEMKDFKKELDRQSELLISQGSVYLYKTNERF